MNRKKVPEGSDLAIHLENNLSSSRFKQILAQDTVLVAEVESRMVGFVQFGMADGYPEANSERDWAVHKLYVLADYQNRGIGSLLMDAVWSN